MVARYLDQQTWRFARVAKWNEYDETVSLSIWNWML